MKKLGEVLTALYIVLCSLFFCYCTAFGGEIDDIRDKVKNKQEPEGFLVKFESNGGSLVPEQRVLEGETVSRPPDPTRPQPWAFVNWFEDRELTEVYNFATPVFDNFTLFARWVDTSLPRYYVYFQSNGGSDVERQHIYEYERAERPPDPTRPGWAFDNWYTDNNTFQYLYIFSNFITGPTTLYARWVPATVSFDKNNTDAGGTEADPSVMTVTPPAINLGTLPVPPTRPGWHFIGWNTAADGAGIVFDASITVTGHTTVYAQWLPVVDSVSLNKQTLTLTVGESETLTATVNPANALNKTVSWESSAPGTASVDQTGKVNALVAGTTTITVTTLDEGKTAECVVTVIVPVITINTHPFPTTSVITGNINGSLSITASVTGIASLKYQWYANTINSNIGGDAISGATGAIFTIPSNLIKETYYYFCTVSATGGAVSVSSNVAIVNMIPPLDIQMVWVPGGSFELGRDLGTAAIGDATPVSTVTLTGFHMGKYQVTQAQYEAVIGNNPSWSKTPVLPETSTANRPVEIVNWYHAIVFCNRLSVMEGLTPAYEMQTAANINVWSTDIATWGILPDLFTTDSRWYSVRVITDSTGYRLPTDAQWEYAAKGGNGSPGSYTYSGSNNADDVAWYGVCCCEGGRTHEVGKKAPNGLGIYDMSGNVWEWCWDWFGSYTSTAKTDPMGASSGTYRVVRGGSWYDRAEWVRSVSILIIRWNESYEFRDLPNYQIASYPNEFSNLSGFRLARP